MENDNLRLELDALRKLLVERADHRLYFNVLRNDHKDGTPISIYWGHPAGVQDQAGRKEASTAAELSLHELDHISRQVFPLLRQIGETVDEVPEDYDGRLGGHLAAAAVLKWALSRTRNRTLTGPHPREDGQTRQLTVGADHPYRVVATAIALVLSGAKAIAVAEHDGEQVEPIGSGRGVSLLDAAERIRPDDEEGQSLLVRQWQKSRKPKLPPSMGKSPEHAQRNLYEPAAILRFLKIVEGAEIDADYGLFPYFRKVSRFPRASE